MMPQKHAVIIGINRYPYYEEKYHLAGCVNDAKLIKHVLTGHFGFPEHNVCELHDEAATREAILAEMDRLVEVAGVDDIIVFHFSGHGRQRTSQTTTEGSGMDSTLMVSDSGPAPHPNLDISDKTINAWLARLAKKTSYTTLIFDACHSGTMTRDVSAATERGIASDTRNLVEMGLTAAPAESRVPDQPKGSSGWLPLSDDYVVLSGCRDSQRSKEFDTEPGSLFNRNGALTFYLTQALMASQPGATYRDVYASAHQHVSTRFPTQNPQIEGPIDRELFATRERQPARHLTVSHTDGSRVVINGGAAHGLTPGGEWLVYRHALGQPVSTQPIATIVLDQVHALVTHATVREHSQDIQPLDRCVATGKLVGIPVLKVALDSVPEELGSIINEQIDSNLWVERAAGEADVTIHAQTAADGWVLASEGAATLPLPSLYSADPDLTVKLVHNLETAARYRHVLALVNDDRALDVAFEIIDGQRREFAVGDLISVEIVNREARSVWFRILVLDANGEISQAYPPNLMGEELRADASLTLEDIELNLKYAATGYAEQTFKVIFTTQPADFSWLLQDALRTSLTPPSNLPHGAASTTRSVSDPDAKNADWQAINTTFSVRKRL